MKPLAAAVLLVCALGSLSALAQTYTVTSQSQAYVPLTATATDVTPTDTDEGYATIPLGFTFPYYGQSFTSVLAHANGMLLFPPNTVCTSGVSSLCYSNGAIPLTTRTYHNLIAAWWDDNEGYDASAAIRYYKPSTSEIVIEYYNWGYFYGSGETFTFQIRLSASGMFQVHYGTHLGSSSTGSASAGFENETGTLGGQILSCTSSCSGGAGGTWPTDTLYTIGQPVAADLGVPTVSLSGMVNDAGSDTLSFTVSPTFRNFGQTDAGNFYWNAFLSTDRILSADGGSSDGGYGDMLIHSSTAPLQCQGLSTVSSSASVAISPRPPPGQYYVLVQADTTNLVTEASEGNNVGSTASYFTQGLDLVATSVSGPAASGPGNTITVNAKWFNQGTDPVGPTGFTIYLSTTTTPHPLTDFVLHSGSKDITGGQTVDEDLVFQVPPNVPGGEFYYVLGIDQPGTGVIAEAQEGNNLAVSSTKVNMQQSDLVIDTVEFLDPVTDAPIRTGYFGQGARMRVTMHNAGGADCANFHIGVTISTDANLSLLSDTIAHDEPVAMLSQGASATVSFNFNLPVKDKQFRDFASGNYYLFAMLDSYGVCTELSKNNNNLILAGAASLRAPAQDYAVTRVDAPASAAVGEVAPLFRSIKNVGLEAGSAVSYRYFASANPIITVQDIPLLIIGPSGAGTESGSVTLGVNAEEAKTEFVRLPAVMPPGTYYLGCIVDPGKLVAELEESNNAMASMSTVQVAAPSLRIATTQLPDATTDRPYNFRLVAQGEQGPSTWTVDTATGGLPEGLSLATDGLISGTPTGATVAAFTVLVNSGSRQAAVRLVLRVLPPTSELEITTRALPPVVNSSQIPYQGALGAAGGVKPYTWRVAAGRLPNGIRLGLDGVFSGAAAAGVVVGETNITFEVQDAVGSRASADLKIRVVVPGALLVKNLTVPDSLVNYDYLTDLAAVNADGTALATPLTWSLASGNLPDGLNLSTQSGERGIIQGKPLVAGTYVFTIQVEDSKGRADSADFILRVFPNRFKVSASNLPAGLHPGDTVDFTLTSSGSNAVSTRFSLYSGQLPPGVTLSEQGQVSGTIDVENSVGVYNFVVQAKDGAGGGGLGAFTLEVTKATRSAGCSAAPGSSGFLGLLGLLPLWLAARRRRATASAVALVAALVLPLSAQAQTVNYQMEGPNPAVGYVSLTGGDLTGISTYNGQAVSFPFDFKYFGQSYSSVTVAQHGYLVFVGDAGEGYNQGIPNTNASTYYPISFIAVWWDYLYKASGSYVRSQTVGTAPNRRLVIEWRVAPSSAGSSFTFEVQIFEGTNQIRFLYGPTLPTSGTASVGLQRTTSSGMAALGCTSASSGTCGSAAFPAGQMFDFLLPPDLSVGSITGDPTAYAGVPFRSTALLKNQGGRTAAGANVRFYLGTAAAFDAGYPAVGDSAPVDLGAGQEQVVTASAPIPPGTAPGDYFLHAKADPTGGMVESDEANNLSVPVLVKVGAPTPDLVASGVSGPIEATAGQTLTVSRTLKNDGNADMTAPVKYTWFVSDNAVVSYSDVPVSPSNSLAVLAAGATDAAASDQVTLPTTLAAGRYWLGLCVDYDPTATPVSTAEEISEVNNCSTAATGFILNTGALAVITTTLPGAAQYSPYGLRLQATGGDGQYAWTLPAGQLPAGLTLNPAGDLTGTPAVAGTFSFDAKVASGGAEVTTSFTLAVTGANLPLTIVPQELPVAEFSRTYLANLVAIGGKPPYIWNVKAESRLPVGLALATDGHLEGRATDAGEFPFSVELTDAAGAKVGADLRIRVVTPSSMHIATTRLTMGYLKKEYLQPLQAVGGKAPYSWSVVKFQQLALNPTDQPGKAETAIPDGYGIKVEQDPSGQYVLRGAPNRAGLAALTLRVQDANGAEDITTLPLHISYEEALAITTVALPDAFVNHSYIAKLSHNGGAQVQGIQYSVPCVMQVGADLEAYGCAASDPMQTTPPGLLLGADGQVTGTPLALPAGQDGKVTAMTYSFLVKVTDSQGREDVRGLSIRVHPDFADEEQGGCSGVPLAPSLGALLASALLALRVRRRR